MTITATQTTFVIGDLDGDGIPDPADIINPTPTTGDTVRTSVVITNTAGADATGVSFIENGDGHLNGMTQVGAINVSPVAFNDSYNAVGNTLLDVGDATAFTGPQTTASGHVTDNDVEYFGDTVTIKAVNATAAAGGVIDATTVNGGTVHMVASGADMGAFYYVSAANFTGDDTFTYTTTDKGLDGIAGNADDLTSTATVTIHVTSQVWYVDNNYAGANGASDGTSFRPFAALSSVSGASGLDDAGDTIYVASSGTNYGGGIALLADQKLIGGGEALVVNATTLKTAGSDATIVNAASGGVGVTLAANNTLKGFTVGDTGTSGNGTDISGAAVGNLVISNVDLNGTGRMVNLTGSGAGTSVNVTFDNASTSSSSTTGVTLSNIDGSVTFGSTPGSASIAGTTGTAFFVSAGSANIDFNGAISKTSDGKVIDVQTHTGTAGGASTISFDGAVSSTSLSDGISLTNNGLVNGTAISFTGALTLNTSASNSAAFTATGGGTVIATGSGNTINSGSGTAINVANTNIGAADLTFQSVSANGSTSGIIVNTTGAAGGLHITGTGSAGTGGTIQNTGQGAVLTSTSEVSFSWMNFTNANTSEGTVNNIDAASFNSAATGAINMSSVTGATLDHLVMDGGVQTGINGQNVSSLTLSNSTVKNFGDEANENNVKLWNLSGTSAITNSTFSLAVGDTTAGDSLVDIRNNTGTLTLNVTGSTFSNSNDSANGNYGLAVTTVGTGTSTVNVKNNDFLEIKTAGIATFARDTSTMNVNITDNGSPGSPVAGTGNTFDPGVGNTGRAIDLNAEDTAHLNFNINRNDLIKGNGGPVVNIFGINNAVIQGRIDANLNMQGGGASTPGSVINVHPEDSSTGIIEIIGNTITNGGQDPAIFAFNHGDGAGPSTDTASLDVTIKNNTITTAGPNTFAIELSTGSDNADQTKVYADVQNNQVTLNGSGNLAFGIANTGGANTFVYLQGFTTNGQTTWNNRGNTPLNSYAELINVNEPAAIPGGHNGGTVITPSNTNALLATDGGVNAASDLPTWHFAGVGDFNGDGAGDALWLRDDGVLAVATINGDPVTDSHIVGGLGAGWSIVGTADLNADGTTDLLLQHEDGRFQAELMQDNQVAATVDMALVDGVLRVVPPSTGGDSPADAPVQPAPGAVATHLTQAQLDAIVSAAIAHWEATGLTAEQDAYLKQVSVTVGDMAGMTLGSANPGHIVIDDNAAGYGWYVDANPADDVEFANAAGVTRLLTDANGLPAGHMDLLTTVMHELGHQLGLGDSYALDDRDSLMYGYLVTGERRLPGEHQADGATPGAIAHEEFLVGPVSIGTLPTGQSVTIQWDATIDAQSNQLIVNASNQGTVTGNQPGAFSVNTDGDPAVGTQPTVTVLDSLGLGNLVFWDKNADGLFNGSDTGINGVTLSLFVDSDNDNAPDSPGSPIATTTTAGGGLYSFTGIAPGHYIVQVDASNFSGPAGALRFLQTSPTTTPNEPTDPDDNVNNDDNGARTLGQAAFSDAITLTYNNEPTAASGNDTNNTLDLGFTNIAPVLDNTASPTLTAINEDAGAPGVGSGTLVSALVDLTPPAGQLDNVSDADSFVTGLALTAVDNSNGTWKYSLNGGTTWTAVGAVTDDNALLLAADSDTRLYFQPNANYNGTSTVTFRAWDQSDGNAEGSTADPTPAGGSTAYSAAFDTAGITVNAVNDAPQFAALDGTPTFTEDGPAVVLDNNATISDVELDAANDYGGATLTLVRSTGANPDDIFTDDHGTLTFGATEVKLGATQVGTYAYTGGTLVITFDTGATSAQADSVLQQLTYRNTSDNPPASVTVNYQFSDGNSGAQGSGATPGLANGSVVVTINAVNDAPVLDNNATPVVATINEDAGAPGVGSGTLISALVDLNPPPGGLDNVTDVDSAVTGVALTAVDNSNGTWKFSLNGGTSWADVGSVTDSSARVLFADANTRVYFQPNANFFGTSSITFRAYDRSDGSLNGAAPVDTQGGGGSTAFSFATDTADVTVNSVNDAPVFTGVAAGVTFNEDAVSPVAIATTVSASDVDSVNYDTGSLRAQITANSHTGDTLSINNDINNISISGNIVSFDADGAGVNPPVAIGTLDAGNSATDILVHLNANADDAAVKALTEAFRYFTASQDPTSDTRTVTFTLVDGGGIANTGQDTTSFNANVAVAASNDKPVVDIDINDDHSVGGVFKTFYIPAGSPAAITDSDVSLFDPDNASMTSATIDIANAKPSDLLSINGGGAALASLGITIDGASTATHLILDGPSSQANFIAALKLVQFSNSLANPDITDRDITVVVNDGAANSDAVHATIVINNPPTVPVDNNGASDAVTEGAPIDTLVGVTAFSTDPENAGPVVYSLTTNPGGFFNIDSGSGVVSVSSAGATGIDFEGSGGSYGITVKATDAAGAFSTQNFTITVNDVAPTQPVDTVAPTGGTVQEGAPNTTTVGITAQSTDVNGGTPTYAITAGNADGAFAINSGTGVITVADATKIDFETATSRLITVQASAGSLTSTQDFTIAVTDAAPTFTADNDGGANTVSEGAANSATVGITAKFDDVNGGTITYSLFDNAGGRFAINSSTGVVTVANAALLNFESATSHNITVRGSDPSGAFADQGFTIAVTNVAPVATGDAYSPTEDTTLTVTAAAGVLANDSDVHGGAITAVLDTGPAHAASFALASDGSFSYLATPDYNGADSFTYHAFDGTAAGNIVTVNLTVGAVADIVNDSVTVVEDSGANTLNLLANDTFENAARAITAVGAAGHGTTSINNNGTPGNTADDFVVYTPAANYSGPDSFTYTVTSNGTTETATVNVTVSAVNDVPLFAGLDNVPSYTENGAAVVLDNNATMSDIELDAANNYSGAVLTLARNGGANAQDVFGGSGTLSFSGGNVLVGATNVGTFTNAGGQLQITFNGNATSALTDSVLQQISYANNSDNPPASAQISYTLSDGNTGSQGTGATPGIASGSITVNITAVNDAPVLSGLTPTVAVTPATPVVTLSPGALASDVDNTTLASATVHISAGTFVGDGDILGVSAGGLTGTGITASYHAATETLTLSGVDTLAHYSQALDHVTFQSTSANPTNSGLNPSRSVDWQLNDGSAANNLSAVGTTTVTLPKGTIEDFNADSTSDVLLGQQSGHFIAEWLMNNGQIGSNQGVANIDADFGPLFLGPAKWRFQDTGDFNADGKADVLWRHDNDGQVVLWTMNGSQITNNQSVATISNDWHNEGVGDFNGDGRADVLWHNDNGQVALWTMNGAQITGNQLVATVGANWHFQGLLDANGDGKSDVLLRDSGGQVVLWTMDGAQITGNQSVANLGLDWNIQGTGDFNGDGKSDVLVRNDSGQVVIWQMNGAQIVSNTSVATPGNDWHVADVGDYNADGRSDILWRNDNGQVSIWDMNGATITNNHSVGSLTPDWSILQHHYDVL